MNPKLRWLSIPVASLIAAAGAAILFAGGGSGNAKLAVASAGPGGAVNLSLAPGLSFTNDSSAAFPIRGDDLADGRIASDRPTAIFFGTAHCWNTNREAERFVALYRSHASEARYLVVDVASPSETQKGLLAHFYRGFIPTLAFLDRRGHVVYNQAGETARERKDISALEGLLKNASSR